MRQTFKSIASVAPALCPFAASGIRELRCGGLLESYALDSGPGRKEEYVDFAVDLNSVQRTVLARQFVS